MKTIAYRTFKAYAYLTMYSYQKLKHDVDHFCGLMDNGQFDTQNDMYMSCAYVRTLSSKSLRSKMRS